MISTVTEIKHKDISRVKSCEISWQEKRRVYIDLVKAERLCLRLVTRKVVKDERPVTFWNIEKILVWNADLQKISVLIR